MTRPSGSTGQWKRGAGQEREQHIADALHAIETEGINLPTAAQHFNIPKKTLGHQKNGRRN
jgi:hypothetical protein